MSRYLVTGPVLCPVLIQSLDVVLAALAPQKFDNVVECQDGEHGNAVLLPDLANRTGSRLAIIVVFSGRLLLPVESNDDADELAALPLDDVDGLPDSSAGSDDIVDDDNLLALERGTDDVAALAVGLGLLAVEAVALPAVLGSIEVGQLVDGCGGQGMPLYAGPNKTSKSKDESASP